MSIIGFNITSIKGELLDAKKMESANVNINSTPRILNIKKTTVPVSGVDDVYSVEFRFETNYDPKVGSIVLEGELFLQTDKGEEIVQTWEEKSALHESVTLEVMNTIMRRSLVKIIQIADDLRLPPPVRFPFYQIAEEDKKKKK